VKAKATDRNETIRTVDGWRSGQPSRLAARICVLGLILTVAAAWGTKNIDDTTEQRLLEQQTAQAGAVLSTAILLIQQPLANALIVHPTDAPGETEAFEKLIGGSVGTDKLFVHASLWRKRGDGLSRLTAVGVAPALSDAAATQAYLKASFSKATFTVTRATVGSQTRIAYALADLVTGYVVYAERAIPANRRAPVDSNSAFADLNYAIYFGPKTETSALSTTDVDPKALPLTGTTATTEVPFGDTVLTVVTSPRHHLGAPLSQGLPLILVGGGLILIAIAIATSRVLMRRRHEAEDSAALAIGMSERLQRALLPLKIPAIPQLEVAVEYVAGVQGVDIGGDWYSVVALDPDHFGFVIGDVSGRGIDAVAVMARARFTLRAYLLRGDSPEKALSESSRQFDISEDGHIATTMVGIGNWRTGVITVANAGHCVPLLLSQGDARYIEIATGPPLGTGPFTFAATTFAMNEGDTLFCFTDGLIERRTEDIDVGMERLAATVAGEGGRSVAQLVDITVRTLRGEQAEDDVAVLAFRRIDS